MVRPREFQRESALEQARWVFWRKGYAATSTDDLVKAMGIGRQSLYNAFGNKWQLYLEALADYQTRSTASHVLRLQSADSALAGIRQLLEGLVAEDAQLLSLGCMGVGSVCEFGASEPELLALREHASRYLYTPLLKRILEGQAAGEISGALPADETAKYLMMSMTGIQLAARAGTAREDLQRLARFVADRLQA